MAAGDKYESADQVLAAASVLSTAARTLTWGREWGYRASLLKNNTEATRPDWRQTGVYLSHLCKWDTDWAHSLQAKICTAHQYQRLHTHTHLHTRSVILWTHNFGGIIHFQEEIFKQKHKVVAPRYWSCSGNKASCRPRSIKFNNRASAKKR